MKTLESMREAAYRAHSGTSFSPEKRAESVVNDYSEELDSDVLKIKSQGADEEQVERYVNGYKAKILKWLGSKSNVMSSMIAGPSNFPVARNQKRSNWADGHYNDFRNWRDKVLNAYTKYEKKQKIEDAGGPLEVAKLKLRKLEETQQFMKDVNKAHAAYLKNPNSLAKSTLSESAQRVIIEYVPQYSWIKHPFAPYQLTNNNAMITNTKKRIEELESKENNQKQGNKEIVFEGGKVILNTEIDRLQIEHDQKPEPEVITQLKKNGFKWSPFYKVWQRQLTQNAIYSAKDLLKIEIKL